MFTSMKAYSSISICFDAVWLLFKYKELRKSRNKMIIIVFMFVECFTDEVKKNHLYCCIAKTIQKAYLSLFSKVTPVSYINEQFNYSF